MSLVKLGRRPAIAPMGSSLFSSEDLPNRIRRLFDDSFFGMEAPDTSAVGWMPPTQIVETTDAIVLSCEVPGMAPKDVNVSVDDGVLMISGEKTEERKEGDDDRKYHLWERTFGSFSRSFTLPRTVDTEHIAAKFENGVLHVTMPKTAEAKSRGRKIEVNT